MSRRLSLHLSGSPSRDNIAAQGDVPATLEDADRLARAAETAFFKHVFTRYYARRVGFSYWRGKHDREVDIIADLNSQLVPFEVKYRGPAHTGASNLKGYDGVLHRARGGKAVKKIAALVAAATKAPAFPYTKRRSRNR